MPKATITQNVQRQLIAKLRNFTQKRTGFTLEHERVRATKTRAENNVYTLAKDGEAVIEVHTNKGFVRFPKNYREVLGVKQ